MKNTILSAKQARSIALEQAIRVLSAEKEDLRDHLTDNGWIGDRLAARFDSSDEDQEKYNSSITNIQNEFDEVIGLLSKELLKIGQFGSKANS